METCVLDAVLTSTAAQDDYLRCLNNVIGLSTMFIIAVTLA